MGSLDPVFCKAAPCMCFIESLFPVTLPRPLQTTVEVPVHRLETRLQELFQTDLITLIIIIEKISGVDCESTCFLVIRCLECHKHGKFPQIQCIILCTTDSLSMLNV